MVKYQPLSLFALIAWSAIVAESSFNDGHTVNRSTPQNSSYQDLSNCKRFICDGSSPVKPLDARPAKSPHDNFNDHENYVRDIGKPAIMNKAQPSTFDHDSHCVGPVDAPPMYPFRIDHDYRDVHPILSGQLGEIFRDHRDYSTDSTERTHIDDDDEDFSSEGDNSYENE